MEQTTERELSERIAQLEIEKAAAGAPAALEREHAGACCLCGRTRGGALDRAIEHLFRPDLMKRLEIPTFSNDDD